VVQLGLCIGCTRIFFYREGCKSPLGRPTRKYQNIIKVNDREIDCGNVSVWNWLRVVSSRGLVFVVMNLCVLRLYCELAYAGIYCPTQARTLLDLVVASKETGLEVNAGKTQYMVMSRNQNEGRSQSIKTDNSSFERVEEFKYLGTTLTNQNSIQEDIKSGLKSRNACYHSVQNLLSSSLLSKNTKFKIHGTLIMPVVLYGCETW